MWFLLSFACVELPIDRPDDAPDVEPPPPIDDTGGVDPGPSGELGTLAGSKATRLDTWPTVNYRGVDTAWGESVGVFLAVYGNAPIGGAFLGIGGEQIGAGFLLTDEDYDGSNWTQNPRVVSDDGGWLVSWHAEEYEGPIPTVRHVTFDGSGPGFAGAAVAIGTPGANQESPIALAWDGTTGHHLAVWAQGGLRARVLGADGTPAADAVQLTDPSVWVESPALATIAGCGCAALTWMEAVDDGARVWLARVSTSTGALVGDPVDLSGVVTFAKVTDVEYDAAADELIPSWYQVAGGLSEFAAARYDPDLNPTAASRTVFSPYGSYDGYDLAWSAVTGTSLAAFHGPDVHDHAAELARDLSDGDAITLDVADATNGVFLPRVVAHPFEPAWFVLGSPDYAGVAIQRVDHR